MRAVRREIRAPTRPDLPWEEAMQGQGAYYNKGGDGSGWRGGWLFQRSPNRAGGEKEEEEKGQRVQSGSAEGSGERDPTTSRSHTAWPQGDITEVGLLHCCAFSNYATLIDFRPYTRPSANKLSSTATQTDFPFTAHPFSSSIDSPGCAHLSVLSPVAVEPALRTLHHVHPALRHHQLQLVDRGSQSDLQQFAANSSFYAQEGEEPQVVHSFAQTSYPMTMDFGSQFDLTEYLFGPDTPPPPTASLTHNQTQTVDDGSPPVVLEGGSQVEYASCYCQTPTWPVAYEYGGGSEDITANT